MSNVELKILNFVYFFWVTKILLLNVKILRNREEFQMLIWTKL
jgi:hypothetical protein